MKTKLGFTVKYSERKLYFLDTTIYLEDGKLEFDVCSKPTDSHLYLLPDSCHHKENTENIPYGVAIRLRRICSKEETFNNRSKEYNQYFVNRDYDHRKVLKHLKKSNKLPGKTHYNQLNVNRETRYLLSQNMTQEYLIYEVLLGGI